MTPHLALVLNGLLNLNRCEVSLTSQQLGACAYCVVYCEEERDRDRRPVAREVQSEWQCAG